LLFAFVGIDKIIWSKACLPDCTTESADGKGFVNGDDTAFVLFAMHDMTATLSDYEKPSFSKTLIACLPEILGSSGTGRNLSLERCQNRM